MYCSVHLTEDLTRIVQDFAEHYHDSWALTKVSINGKRLSHHAPLHV